MAGDDDARRTERELLGLADELLRQAAELKRQWAELGRAAGAPSPAAGEPPGQALGPAADPRRLVALEMMLSGRDRGEIEAHLRAEFGGDAAREIVAQIYGED